MESDNTAGRCTRHLLSDLGPPVSALNSVLGVAQTIHQDDERFGHPHRVPAATGRWPRKSKARQRWNHHIKSRRLAVRRIREWLDHRKKFHDRAGPSMQQQQRYRARSRRAFVDEVDRLPVALGCKLREAVEPSLLGAPVVTLLPIVCELADFADVSAVLPGRAGKLV